jgi:hypothetical protein
MICKWYLGLALSFSQTLAPCQSFDTRCREFQDLVRQDGLAWSINFDRSFLLGGEKLEPLVTALNSSPESLIIPDLEKVSGVAVIEPSSHNFHWPTRNRETEEKFCSFAKIVLQPGETRRFDIQRRSQDKKQAFRAEVVPHPANIETAMLSTGRHPVFVWMGSYKIGGEYLVREPIINEIGCVRKELRDETVIDRTKTARAVQPSSEGKYCRLAGIANLDGEMIILASSVDIGIEIYDGLKSESARLGAIEKSRFWLRHLPFRMTTFLQDVRFASVNSDGLIDGERGFVVTSDGTKLTLESIRRKFVDEEKRR